MTNTNLKKEQAISNFSYLGCKKVYVGISGGVDSSVSLFLLREAGLNVTGVFIKAWYPEWLDCNWRDERDDAMRVCAQLEVPFKEIDLSEEYKKEVVEYMIDEYREGRTPNPDVMCNQKIKFGGFLSWAKREGADFVATGHYANKCDESSTNDIEGQHLCRGIDESKDQSYFLWSLSRKDLKSILFPVGQILKTEVRDLAKEAGLFTKHKPDSQGLCFLGHVDMKQFLKKYVEIQPGEVLNSEGEIIGEHNGAILYTIGERRGFTITKKTANDKPRYVIDKDVSENTITVSEKPKVEGATKQVSLEKTNWISVMPEIDASYQGQVRYQQVPQACKLRKISDDMAIVEFDQLQTGVAVGQSCVLYKGDMCLGGGIIKDRIL